MKKILKIFLILLLLMTIPVVHADENDTNTQDTWGQKYTKGQFEYTIDGFVLNVYELSTQSTEGLSEEAAAQAQQETIQSLRNYLNEEPTRVIELTPANITPNISYKVDKFSSVDTLFINLGHDLTKEKLETLLALEMNSVSEEKRYIVDVCVKYTLTKIPEKFKNFYSYDITRALISAIIGGGGDNLSRLDVTKSNTQVLNRVTIQIAQENTETAEIDEETVTAEVVEEEKEVEETKEEEKNNVFFGYDPDTFELIPPVGAGETPGEKVLTYERVINDSNTANFLNLIVLSTKDYSDTENTTDNEITEDDLYYIMFHEAENIDTLIELTKDTNPITSTDTEPEAVKVGDTSKMMSGYVYVGSAILILAGFGIVMHVIKQKQRESGKRI